VDFHRLAIKATEADVEDERLKLQGTASKRTLVMDKHARIYIAGHRGMVGSAIVRALTASGFDNLIVRTSKELDLRDNGCVAAFFAEAKPDYVFLAAAKVGGILANTHVPSRVYL